MQNLEAVHKALDELAISLVDRDAVLHMLAYNREVMENYRRLFERLEQVKPSPNGKPKEVAQP